MLRNSNKKDLSKKRLNRETGRPIYLRNCTHRGMCISKEPMGKWEGCERVKCSVSLTKYLNLINPQWQTRNAYWVIEKEI